MSNDEQQKDKPQFRLQCIGCTKAKRFFFKKKHNELEVWLCTIHFVSLYLFFDIFGLDFPVSRCNFSLPHTHTRSLAFLCCIQCGNGLLRTKSQQKNQFSFGRQHLHIDALVLQISKIRTLQMQYYFELGIYLCRNTSVKPLKILQKHHSPRFMRNLFIVNLLALFCFVVVWRNAKHFLYFLCNECQNKSNCNCVDYFVLGLLSVRIPFFFLICYKIQYKNK